MKLLNSHCWPPLPNDSACATTRARGGGEARRLGVRQRSSQGHGMLPARQGRGQRLAGSSTSPRHPPTSTFPHLPHVLPVLPGFQAAVAQQLPSQPRTLVRHKVALGVAVGGLARDASLLLLRPEAAAVSPGGGGGDARAREARGSEQPCQLEPREQQPPSSLGMSTSSCKCPGQRGAAAPACTPGHAHLPEFPGNPSPQTWPGPAPGWRRCSTPPRTCRTGTSSSGCC